MGIDFTALAMNGVEVVKYEQMFYKEYDEFDCIVPHPVIPCVKVEEEVDLQSARKLLSELMEEDGEVEVVWINDQTNDEKDHQSVEIEMKTFKMSV